MEAGAFPVFLVNIFVKGGLRPSSPPAESEGERVWISDLERRLPITQKAIRIEALWIRIYSRVPGVRPENTVMRRRSVGNEKRTKHSRESQIP